MKSELLELRDELGWANGNDEKINKLVGAVMDCLTEIDSLRLQVNTIYEDCHKEASNGKLIILWKAIMDIACMEKGHDCKCECANHCIARAEEARREADRS